MDETVRAGFAVYNEPGGRFNKDDIAMPAVPVSLSTLRGTGMPLWLRNPPRRVQIAVWMTVAALLVGLRVWTAVHVPTYLWTRDSGSYVAPATAWLKSGRWINSARRGPVYSLFIAAIFRAGGNLTTVAAIQAAIGVLTGSLTLLMARAWLGRRAFWPLAFCSLLYALYGLPIGIERLIRNETLLTLFATAAFGGWFCALRTGKPGWFALSGLATGLMQLLKGIFPVFPLLVLAIAGWTWRRRPGRLAKLAGCYILLFAAPLVASKLYDRLSGTARPPEPEAGEMFYGRTAQWTRLDGGIVPEIKARIRDQVTAYAERFRRTGALDNNEIVKRTVVPNLKKILVEEGHKRAVDVDRLCWRLGMEAVAHHPFAYFKQVAHDFYTLNFVSAHRFILFLPHELESSAKDAAAFATNPAKGDPAINARVFDLAASRAVLHEAARSDSSASRFSRFITATGRMRLLSPVLLTTLCLPLLVWLRRGRERLFWLGSTVLWFYYLCLLSTVGRPLDRYLMPVVPIMFWAITTAAAIGWSRGLKWHATRKSMAAAA